MTTNKRVSPGRAMYQAAEALQRKSEAQAERIAELEQQVEALRDALLELGREAGVKAHRRGDNLTWKAGSYLWRNGNPLPGCDSDPYQVGYREAWEAEQRAHLDATGVR